MTFTLSAALGVDNRALALLGRSLKQECEDKIFSNLVRESVGLEAMW